MQLKLADEIRNSSLRNSSYRFPARDKKRDQYGNAERNKKRGLQHCCTAVQHPLDCPPAVWRFLAGLLFLDIFGFYQKYFNRVYLEYLLLIELLTDISLSERARLAHP